jgi:hypothetical protein
MYKTTTTTTTTTNRRYFLIVLIHTGITFLFFTGKWVYLFSLTTGQLAQVTPLWFGLLLGSSVEG